MKSAFTLEEEIKKLEKQIINKGIRKLTSSNIQKQKKLEELIKKNEQVSKK